MGRPGARVRAPRRPHPGGGSGSRRPWRQPHGACVHRRPQRRRAGGRQHAVGLASQPTSVHREDGLRLIGCRMTAAVHCAPPQNRPTPQERATCLPHLVQELRVVPAAVVVALGALAWDATLAAFAAMGHPVRPKPRFGHGAEARVGGRHLLGSYHPSQQNTFTGRLTPAMLEDVLGRAAALAGGS
ncbi:MAG: uracil-DNA glycosylase family protein [Thermoleophilia bacterium]